MTTAGFFSAVAHRDLPDHMLIRGRSYADLTNLLDVAASCDTAWPAEAIVVSEPFTSDYPYRVTMPTEIWARCLGRLAALVDYDNFKSAVHDVQGYDRAHTYMRVWSALHDIADEPTARPPGRQRPAKPTMRAAH